MHELLDIKNVGALIERPRREGFRIRIGFRQIRRTYRRAIDDRPYILKRILTVKFQLLNKLPQHHRSVLRLLVG